MLSDRPIESCDLDMLERKDFSHMIGDVLINLPLGDQLCIGLMGPWGSGKTSIINMVAEYIESEERDPRINIMSFSPWNFSSTEQLVSQFFLQLAELFGVDQTGKKDIGAAITRYASGLETSALSAVFTITSPLMALIPFLMKKGLEESGKAIEKMAFQNKSIQKQKDEIQKLLENTKEKIVIVIDDIDRLNDDQIRCVFQLVTVICKFPNISYLLAFDRSIVSKALDQLQDNRGDEYLDKVIQVPVSVPVISKKKLFSFMALHMNELAKLYGINDIDGERWNDLYGICVSRLINTQRDILRLSNSLRAKLSLVSKDTNFEDLVILTTIEQHEPKIYEWIKQHGEMLTGQLSYENRNDFGNSDQDKRNRKERYQNEIEQLLQHNNRFTTELAFETMCILFPAFSSKTGSFHAQYNELTLRKRNNIGHPLKFDRFFSLKINDDQITYSELYFIINEATEEEIISIVLEKDNRDASVELFDELRTRIQALTKEKIKVFISCLQKIGDLLKSQSSNGLFSRSASGEAMYIINELLRHLDVEDRYRMLEQMIFSMCESNINLTSYVLNKVYLAHNKIMDDEKKNLSDRYPKLSSDDELKTIEAKYLDKVKEIRDSIDVYKMIEKRLFIHFYSHFPERKEYLTKTISAEPRRIIFYLFTNTSQLHRLGRKKVEEIEITGDYKELVTDDQVKQAIKSCIDSGEIFDLELDQQRVVVAYLMKEENHTGEISVLEIDQKRIAMLTKKE